MSLKSLLEEWRYQTPVNILPELREKMLNEIKERYRNVLDPEIWRLYLSDDPECEFPTGCHEIISDVIKKHLNLNETLALELANELFDESEAFCYEVSIEVKDKIDFVDRLIGEANLEIESYFPDCKNAFGDSATQLLVDLAFQYRVCSYSKSVKSELADIKRMINICGQVVEDIFCMRVFLKPKKIGDISRELNAYTTRNGSGDRETFFRQIPFGKKLIGAQFLQRLRRIARLRNDYSHGTTSPADPKTDFFECVQALLEQRSGILFVLYDCISGNANRMDRL